MDEAAEAYYAGLSATLNAFNAPSNWRRDGRAIEALPRQVAFDAGQIIEDLLDGRLRPSIDHLFFRRGRPGVGAIQRRAIEAAVRYVAAVNDGLVECPDPLNHVAENYGVRSRTIRRWVAAHPEELSVVERLDQTRAADQLQQLLTRHMQEQAALYRGGRNVKRRR
jgi:hypothetical protein